MAATYALSLPARSAGNDKYLGPYGPAGANPFIASVTHTGKLERRGILTATGTYTTGGDPVLVSLFGLSRADEVWVAADDAFGTNTNGGTVLAAVLTTPGTILMKLYNTVAGELAGATGITNRSFYVRVIGY